MKKKTKRWLLICGLIILIIFLVFLILGTLNQTALDKVVEATKPISTASSGWIA